MYKFCGTVGLAVVVARMGTACVSPLCSGRNTSAAHSSLPVESLIKTSLAVTPRVNFLGLFGESGVNRSHQNRKHGERWPDPVFACFPHWRSLNLYQICGPILIKAGVWMNVGFTSVKNSSTGRSQDFLYSVSKKRISNQRMCSCSPIGAVNGFRYSV